MASDRWGQGFPVRLLALAMQNYLTVSDIVITQSLCRQWRLPCVLQQQVWRYHYLRNCEPESLWIENMDTDEWRRCLQKRTDQMMPDEDKHTIQPRPIVWGLRCQAWYGLKRNFIEHGILSPELLHHFGTEMKVDNKIRRTESQGMILLSVPIAVDSLFWNVYTRTL